MRRRGLTLIELLTALGLFSIVFFGATSLLVAGIKSYNSTMLETNLAQKNALGMRRVVETLREAMSVSITNGGNTITYTLPKRVSNPDPTTGEYEYFVPLTSDGVARSFRVESGNLIDSVTGRVLIRNLLDKDPYPSSSQYNQVYPPFQMTSIGSTRAVSINFITGENVGGKLRYARMKTTVLMRNVP